MKIVFLEADSLGEDMKLDHFFEIGEVVVYGKTTVAQVPERIAEAYGGAVDCIVDGGDGGLIPSTIVDCTADEIQIVRYGKGDLEE